MSLTIDLGAGGLRGGREELGTPDGRLSFKRKLGEGSEGSVYLAVPVGPRIRSSLSKCRPRRSRQGGGSIAVKVVTGDAFQRYRQTRCLWPYLAHPNIVYPRKAMFDDRNSRCFVEMELCDTDLLEMVIRDGPLSDSCAARFASHLASALAHCHSQGIAHRDIKLENIFVRGGLAKLGDFGSIVQVSRASSSDTEDDAGGRVATHHGRPAHSASTSARSLGVFFSPSSPSPFAYSTAYAPPEAFEGATSNESPCSRFRDVVPSNDCDDRRQAVDAFASDMWSLGIVLYAAVAKHHPWERACRSDANFVRFIKLGAERFFPSTFSAG